MTVLRLEDFFDEPAKAYGVFQDRFGRPRRMFNADVQPSFEKGVLTLKEFFTFDDGVEEERVWRIQPEGDGRYSATANGVIGSARGQVDGPALRWHYTFALDIGSRVLHVQFDDWMCQQSESVLINRAIVKKWGIRIGDLTIVFIRHSSSLLQYQPASA